MKWTNTHTLIACISAVAVIAGAIVAIEKSGAGKTSGRKSEVNKQPAKLSPETQARIARLSPDVQLSPFTAVKYDGDTVMVTFSGTDYQLTAIDDLSTVEILNFCKRQYKDMWQKRFAEDLVVVLSDMGHPVSTDQTIGLTLVDPKTGEKKNIEHAPMTGENRQAVHRMLSMN
jgi:hypothetical protein